MTSPSGSPIVNRNGSDTAPTAAAAQPARPREGFGAVRTLRLLLVSTIVVPLLLGAVAGYLSYRATVRRAEAALGEAVAVAEENTIKVLDTHVLVAERIADLLSGSTDDQIRVQEQALHERLARQIENLPEVAAAWVIDANGRELVSARVYPVNRDLDHAGRADFRALQNPQTRTFIWALRAKSLDEHLYRPYFTVSRRWQTPDGTFRGVIIVAVSGSYFGSFYHSLLGGSAEYTAEVYHEDGVRLARYPEEGKVAANSPPDAPLSRAFAEKSDAGIIVNGAPSGWAGSVVAYRRVANYPVYVTIGRTLTSIVRQWLEAMAGYAAVGAAAAIGLMLLTLLALRRTRREQIALAQARDAIAERAASEAQLHQAQKMEAVGLLTAGIAHDFNNMLTVISGNIGLLQLALEDRDQKLRKLVASALVGCERAMALTKRLLEFSRREPLDPQPLDVNETITGMSDLLRRALSDKIVVATRLAEGVWPVFVDPNRFENALLNLAVNARDAVTGLRGRLTIETANCPLDENYAARHPDAAVGDHVSISVSDTGSGMPQEILEKAFDPFFTTKAAGKGTGLGLSQVHAFVARSGGHCAIDSTPGQGTTVTLYLPRHGEAIPPAGGDPLEMTAEKDRDGTSRAVPDQVGSSLLMPLPRA